MTTGKQLAGLLLLTTALTLPGIALAQDGEPAQGTQDENQAEEQDRSQQPDISIPGGNTIIVTGRINRDPTQSSTQAISVLSTEQIARTGEGDIAGALGRVTGLSVQGNGFVFVRGLGDRYSLALLNGLPLPSPEPLSRVVPLDIFPTSVIASSLVQKTYSANFPGEFGGGVINLTTRAIPDESFLTVSGGVSANSETTFQSGLSYFGSDFDIVGFDDGARDAPPALQTFFDNGIRISELPVNAGSAPDGFEGQFQSEIIEQLGNPNLILLQRLGDVPANWSAGLTAGTAFDFGDDGRFGVIATGSVSNKWRTRDITKQSFDGAFALNRNLNDVVTDNRLLVNALIGFGLEVGDHQFRFTNLFIRDTLKQATFSEGTIATGQTDNIQEQRTAWFERQLLDSQFVAELAFGDVSIDLRGGYAKTQREAPFEYTFQYVQAQDTTAFAGSFLNNLDGREGLAQVAFSDLEEELWSGGIDIGYQVLDSLTATIGYAYSDTARISTRREFDIRAQQLPDGVGLLRPDLLLGDALINAFDYTIFETTELDPSFDAALEVHAGYGKINWEPITGVLIDAGVRYEDAVQTVSARQVFVTQIGQTGFTNLSNDYWLPGATITFEPIEDFQLRANASKTIARPQFRELLLQTYFDPETNREFSGNPFLIDSRLTNYELRAEYYFGGGDRVSLAGFYKEIQNPIEAFSSFSDNDQITGFVNAPLAELYGAEAEVQYTIDLLDLGGFFQTKELLVLANYTFTNSTISVQDGDVAVNERGLEQPANFFFVDGVPLTGQSDHLANFQVSLEDVDRLQQFTVLVNYSSERVTSRGTSGLPDILEDPGLTVDLVWRQGLSLAGSDAELKVEARNIFGRRNEEFQTNGVDRAEINTYDVGTSFGASLSFQF